MTEMRSLGVISGTDSSQETAQNADLAALEAAIFPTFDDVAAAEAGADSDNSAYFVDDVATMYRYEANGSAYTRDGTHILNTADGGATRLIAIAGRYKYNASGPVFSIAGSEDVAWDTEEFTNYNFAADATGWTLDSGAVWLASGDVRLYHGRVTAVAVGSSGGSGYSVGDVLTVTDATGNGLTVTVTSVAGGVVDGVSIATNGKQYAVAADYATTGGSGTGCLISVTTITGGKISRSISLESNEVYTLTPVLSSNYASMHATLSCPNAPWEQNMLPTTGRELSETVSFTAVTTSGTLSFQAATSSDMSYYMRIHSISLKKVTSFYGKHIETIGTSGSTLFALRNGDEAQGCLFGGGSAGQKFALGQYCMGWGEHALEKLNGGYETTAFGARAGNTLTFEYGATLFGAAAGADQVAGATLIEVALFGQSPLANASGNCNYTVALGQTPGEGAHETYGSIFIGKQAAENSSGHGNIYIGQYAGYGLTDNFRMIISPAYSTNWYLDGIHDYTGTTGFLKLRGDFLPQATGTYDFGSSSLEWANLYLLSTGKVLFGNTQILSRGAGALTGNLIVGDGGGSLTHGSGYEGYYNAVCGFGAGINLTTGSYCALFGYQAGNQTASGQHVAAFGYQAGFYNTTSQQVFFGTSAGFSTTTGPYNTYIGYNSGFTNQTGSNGVYIGYKAGFYETATNKFFIDSIARSNEADGRAKALIYGLFDAAIANQFVQINGMFACNGVTPSAQPSKINDPSGGGTQDAEARTAIASIIDVLESYGFSAAA